MSWDIIYKVVGFIAVVVGIYWTFRQIHDKSPRLRVDFERTCFPPDSGVVRSGDIARPIPSLTIRLRNLTERKITIEKTCFIDAKKQLFVVPNTWKTVSEIPPHDHRTFVVSVPEFEKWSKDTKMFRPEKGRFVLVDAIGKRHKSWKLKKSLSMEPMKLP